MHAFIEWVVSTDLRACNSCRPMSVSLQECGTRACILFDKSIVCQGNLVKAQWQLQVPAQVIMPLRLWMWEYVGMHIG